MKTLRLSQIKALGPDEYEPTLDGARGPAERVMCRVFEHRGVTAVRFAPDVFVTGRASAREVTAAMLAHHRARREGAGS